MNKKEEATKDQLYKEIVYLSEQKKYSLGSLVLAGGIGYAICMVSFLIAYTLLYA